MKAALTACAAQAKARMDMLPKGWKVTTVGKSCRIRNNIRTPINENERKKIKGIYPYYGPTGILDYINQYKIDEDFSLIGEDGDHFFKYNEKEMTIFSSGKASINNHAHVILNSKECLAKYFYLYFMHKDITMNITRQGAKRYKLNKNSLENISIILPPISEQEKIATIISTWDKAISTTDALLVNSRQQKKALMQQLLTGKRRLPGFTGEWKVVRAGSVLHEESTRNRGSKITRVLSVTNQKGFVLPEEQFSKRVASDNIENYKIIKQGQFGYNPSRLNVGSFGRLDTFEEGILSPLYVIFSLKDQLINSDFFLAWMLSEETKQRVKGSSQGSVRESVSFNALASFPLYLPPLDEQRAIAAVLDAADREISLLEQKAARLRDEKKALMQQLLTGKRQVRL